MRLHIKNKYKSPDHANYDHRSSDTRLYWYRLLAEHQHWFARNKRRLPDYNNDDGCERKGVSGLLAASAILSVIVLCSSLTGFSPFSSGGALALAGVQEEAERNKLFYRLLLVPPFGVIGVLLFVFFGLLG